MEQKPGAVEVSDTGSVYASAGERKASIVKPRRPVRLSAVISLSDFERAAESLLPPTSYAFISTGAEDNWARSRNQRSWQTLRLRPRILRPIERIDMSRTILGTRFSLPVFVCPAGGAKLCHSDGDALLTQAAGDSGMLHWVCSNASSSQQELVEAGKKDQVLYWQIYALSDLRVTEEKIKSAAQLGYKGFALTVDATRAGKREGDLRSRIAEEDEADEDGGEAETEAFKKEPKVARP